MRSPGRGRPPQRTPPLVSLERLRPARPHAPAHSRPRRPPAAQRPSRCAHRSLKGPIRRAAPARRGEDNPQQVTRQARLLSPCTPWPVAALAPLRTHEPSQREDVPLRGHVSRIVGRKLGHDVTSPVCDNVRTIPSERGDSGPHRGGLLQESEGTTLDANCPR